MSALVHDRVRLEASPEAIRSMLHDADALHRVLPGCESLEATGPDTYAAVLAVRIGFMTIRADATARVEAGDADAAVRLAIAGKPRGLAGSFTVDVPFLLEADGDGTQVTYDIDLTVSGRLAAFGTLILRDATRRQIADLVRNVEREARA